MNIVVCVKQVPDTTEVKLDPVKGTLIRDGVPSIINPDDKAALEAAFAYANRRAARSLSSAWVLRKRMLRSERRLRWVRTRQYL